MRFLSCCTGRLYSGVIGAFKRLDFISLVASVFTFESCVHVAFVLCLLRLLLVLVIVLLLLILPGKPA